MSDDHTRDLLVVGGSAGGFEALFQLLAGLPSSLPAAVCVVLHTSAEHESRLAEVLNGAGPLPVTFATDNEVHQRGHVYIAPPDHHLLIAGPKLVLGSGPKENRTRPAIDPLFRSAALSHGSRAIGLILSGMQDDGTSGLMAIKRGGGVTIVQSPSDAPFPDMPANAIKYVVPDHVAAIADLPALLVRLIDQTVQPQTAPLDDLRIETAVAAGKPGIYDFDKLGKPSFFACPDCHGVMHEIDEGEFMRFRCHVGHAHSARDLEFAIDDDLWRALSSALRALEERATLLQRMAAQAVKTGARHSAGQFDIRAKDYMGQAETVRRVIAYIEGQRSAAEAAPV